MFIAMLLAILLVQSTVFAAEISSQEQSRKGNIVPEKTPFVIAIDPGHPSETSDGCNHFGVSELQICWEVALKLEKLIAAEPRLRSIKTRDHVETRVTNRERAEIANAGSSAVMVRLHCDSGKGSGCTVYYPDKPGKIQGVTGPSRDIIEQSQLAAQSMQEGLKEILGKELLMNPVKTDSVTFVGSKQGALTGSIFAKVPAIVVEMVYLSNASDAAFISNPVKQDLMARGILTGLKKFLKME